MSRQILNTGGAANDGQGDTLRNASQKINDNFAELYNLITLTGDGGGGGDGGGLTTGELQQLVEEEITSQLSNIDLDGGSVNILLYKGYDQSDLPSDQDINVSTTYNFETGSLFVTNTISTDFNGWSFDLPTTGRYVFLIRVVVTSNDITKIIEVSDWSDPVLAYDRGLPNLEVDILATNGVIFRNDTGQTEIKAFITSDGTEISSNDYKEFDYEWTNDGVPVCVHETTRYVSHIDGNIVTVGSDGTCPIGYGVPATNSGATDNFSNGELKSIFIEAQAVPNSGTLPLQLTINDKQED